MFLKVRNKMKVFVLTELLYIFAVLLKIQLQIMLSLILIINTVYVDYCRCFFHIYSICLSV